MIHDSYRNTDVKWCKLSRRLCFIVMGLLSAHVVWGQIEVESGNVPPDNVVNDYLMGGNIIATNVSFSGFISQLGVFSDGEDDFNLETGVVLSNHTAVNLGCAPYDCPSCPGVSSNAELLAIVNDYLSAEGFNPVNDIYDVGILEFDVVPLSEELSFRYVYASTEYSDSFALELLPENNWMDLFAIFVSGPGIVGPYSSPAGFPNGSVNIATIPGLNPAAPISNKSISPLTNSSFFIDFDETESETICVHGMTEPLTASVDVICDELYHVKMVILDGRDPTGESFVLLERQDLESPDAVEINWTMNWQAVDSPVLFEGCGTGEIVFNRPVNIPVDEQYVVSIDYSLSSATANADYAELPQEIIFAPGQTQVVWSDIGAIADSEVEGSEFISMELIHSNACLNGGGSTYFIIEIAEDPPPLEVNSFGQSVCDGEEVTIVPVVTGGFGNYGYLWSDGSQEGSLETWINGDTDLFVTISDTCGVSSTTGYFSFEAVAFPELALESDVLACGEVQLDANIIGLNAPSCGDDAGSYSYCYGNLITETWSFCPDNPGDGTFMEINFSQGGMFVFDELTFFDGPDEFSPILAGPFSSDLSGLSIAAQNSDGCLTMKLTTNSSISCESGNLDEWHFNVGCNNLSGYHIEWSPAEAVSDSEILEPIVNVEDLMLLTLDVSYATAPYCAASSSLTIQPSFQIDLTYENPTCFDPDGIIELEMIPMGAIGPWVVQIFESGTEMFTLETSDLNLIFDGLSAGEYEIFVSDEHCSFSELIELFALPEVTIEVFQDTTICSGGSAWLEAIPSFPDPNLQWTWNNGINESGQWVSPNSTTSYSCYASVAPGCNTFVQEVIVSVLDTIQVNGWDDTALCDGDSLLLSIEALSGGLAPYSLDWSSNAFNDNPSDDVMQQWISPSLTTSYCVEISDACETPDVTICAEVYVPEDLDPSFDIVSEEGCLPFTVSFEGALTSAAEVAEEWWQFGDGFTSDDIQNTEHVYLEIGLFDVSHTITSIYGCTYMVTEVDAIRVSPSPIAEFAASPWEQTLPNRRVEFENYSLGANSFYWEFDELDASQEVHPVYYFPEEVGGEYDILLVATNEWGCSDSIAHPIWIVDSFVLYIPNVFTPDQDGINDAWWIVGHDVDPSEFELKIYDRWGKVVFETTEITDVWVGDYRGGDYFVANGTYLYEVKARALSTGAKHRVSGHIEVIR